MSIHFIRDAGISISSKVSLQIYRMSYFLRMEETSVGIQGSCGSLTYSFEMKRPCAQQLPPVYFFPGQPDVGEGQ